MWKAKNRQTAIKHVNIVGILRNISTNDTDCSAPHLGIYKIHGAKIRKFVQIMCTCVACACISICTQLYARSSFGWCRGGTTVISQDFLPETSSIVVFTHRIPFCIFWNRGMFVLMIAMAIVMVQVFVHNSFVVIGIVQMLAGKL